MGRLAPPVTQGATKGRRNGSIPERGQSPPNGQLEAMASKGAFLDAPESPQNGARGAKMAPEGGREGPVREGQGGAAKGQPDSEPSNTPEQGQGQGQGGRVIPTRRSGRTRTEERRRGR